MHNAFNCISGVDIALTLMKNSNINVNPIYIARNLKNARSGLIPKHRTYLEFHIDMSAIEKSYIIDCKVDIIIYYNI